MQQVKLKVIELRLVGPLLTSSPVTSVKVLINGAETSSEIEQVLLKKLSDTVPWLRPSGALALVLHSEDYDACCSSVGEEGEDMQQVRPTV
jgi:hypothetical protein